MAKIAINVKAESQSDIVLFGSIATPITVTMGRSKQWQIVPCPAAGWAGSRAAGAAIFAGLPIPELGVQCLAGDLIEQREDTLVETGGESVGLLQLGNQLGGLFKIVWHDGILSQSQ
ncbi:hypothetical protein BFW41_22300 [Aeromonas hydrophila]|nr:hypothetical protein BFW41_22300 [Aeromonas hydrophila]